MSASLVMKGPNSLEKSLAKENRDLMAKGEKRVTSNLGTINRRDVAMDKVKVDSNHKDQSQAIKIKELSNNDLGKEFLIIKMKIDKEWPLNKASNLES